ncbi:hypothetical protein [Deinococcus cellulosilyticus]|uniref:Uncharacterized protein n=1 Tax=Deinococcus cellulosilyticus (strain DSM 18568 / NBRC 106333 / KACC 11606 / 5516J-15) TaxID=1223518 RepID=A0A511MZF9_DEIC1|nr:hypothetical protein [Deinococcus cellulosilyticus]GEM45929.1 hypothetical protein DC3_15640 [Deinococcus cellulosilyticus NBRC 106333 = KACC 11606]
MNPALFRRTEPTYTLPAGAVGIYDFVYDPANPQRLTDLSGNGNHGQLGSTSGADTDDPAWGPDGYGLIFDAIDDFVSLPLALGNLSTYTYICAVEQLSFLSRRLIIGGSRTDGSVRNGLSVITGGMLELDNYLPSGGALATPRTLVQNGNQCVVAVRQSAGTNRAIFWNRLKMAEDSAPETYGGGAIDAFRLGRRSGSTADKFHARYDYSVIYNRALMDEEYLQAYLYIRQEMKKRGRRLP